MREKLYQSIALQIRTLRELNGWSQRELGQRVDMHAERISCLENPNYRSKARVETLLRLAEALNVELEVRFVSQTPERVDVYSLDNEILRSAHSVDCPYRYSTGDCSCEGQQT